MNMMSPLFLVLFLSALKVSNKAQLAQTKNYYSAGRPIIRKVSKIRIWVQGGAGGLAVGWVDLDLECSTILLGQ